MNVEIIKPTDENPYLPVGCKIELTLKEAEAILHSLSRSMCKGDQLTISMELEDKLFDVIKPYR